MFWSSPSADINIIIFLLIVSFGIAVASYMFSKKILVAVFVMSLLSNAAFYFGTDYNLSRMYGFVWLFEFARNIWPYINLVLGVLLVVSIMRKRSLQGIKNI